MKMFALTDEEVRVIKAFRQLRQRQRLLLLSAIVDGAHNAELATMAWAVDKVLHLQGPSTTE